MLKEIEYGGVCGYQSFGLYGVIGIVSSSRISEWMQKRFYTAQLKEWVWITNRYPKSNFMHSDWCMNPTIYIKSLAQQSNA